jgi:O-antigen ligase
MFARARGFQLLPAGGLATAAILVTAAMLGVLAAIQPLIAIAAVGAIVLASVVFTDLAMGFATLAFLSFLDILPKSGSLSLAKGAGLLLAVAWLARFGLSQRGERDFFADHSHLAWVMIAFIGWAAVTLVWALQSGPGISALSRYIPNMLLLPIAYTAVRSRRDLTLVLGAILFGAVIAAGFGIVQPADASENIRATGTIGDPNELAAALLVGLALGAGFALARGRSPMLRLAGLFAVPLCAAGIFLSLSRGGLLALGGLLVAGTVFAGRWRLAMTAILLAVVAGGVLYFTQLAPLPARERITTVNGGSGRSDLWTVGLRIVRAHPVGGIGVGNFQNASPNFVLQPGLIKRSDLIFSAAPKVAHNTYLQVLAEMGVPGLLLFLALIGACAHCALRAARTWARRGEVTMEALARAVFLALVGMLVAYFFISQMYGKLLWVLLALGPAMLAIARHESDGEDPVAAWRSGAA